MENIDIGKINEELGTSFKNIYDLIECWNKLTSGEQAQILKLYPNILKNKSNKNTKNYNAKKER